MIRSDAAESKGESVSPSGEATPAEARLYRIGRFTLQPHRQLRKGTQPVAIGRKPLDVLSALAKAEGALVTKDELMGALWPQAVVEDNALQAHIAALRKLLGPDANLLSTSRGLGYSLHAERLTSADAPEAVTPAARSPGPDRPRGRQLSWGLAAPPVAIAFLLAAGWAGLQLHASRPAGDHEMRIAIAPFVVQGADPQAHALAQDLLTQIPEVMSENHLQVLSGGVSGWLSRIVGIGHAGPDLVLHGAIDAGPDHYDVHLHLDDAREHVIVWSDQYSGPKNRARALEATVAAHAADAVNWAKVGRSGPTRLDPATLMAFINGRESTTGVRASSPSFALAEYAKVSAAAPDFSWGHSGVAVSAGFKRLTDPDPTDQDALRRMAQTEAREALKLDPRNGEAFLALELVMPRHEWSRREALLLEGAAKDPDFEPVALMEGRLLWAAGRGRDALPWFWRAHQLNSLHNGASLSLVLALASLGYREDADALLKQMQIQWPEHPVTREAAFWTAILDGATDRALAMLDNSAERPAGRTKTWLEAWRLTLQAVKAVDERPAAARQMLEAAASGSVGHAEASAALTLIGRLDDALAQAAAYEPSSPIEPPFLFMPVTARLRADPRFIGVARKLGLVDYWRSSGRWPDFCLQPGLSYACADAARREP